MGALWPPIWLSVPLPLLLAFAGVVTALVAIVVGLPALRMPGLFLAVTTLAFAIFMQEAVLATPCWTVPGINKTLCTGLPNPASTLIGRPAFFGLSLQSERSFAWFSLGMLLLSILAVRVWRDKGVARRLVAVRDNELGAAAMGIPVLRTKLHGVRAFGFHGRLCRRLPCLLAPSGSARRPSIRPSHSSSSPWW